MCEFCARERKGLIQVNEYFCGSSFLFSFFHIDFQRFFVVFVKNVFPIYGVLCVACFSFGRPSRVPP